MEKPHLQGTFSCIVCSNIRYPFIKLSSREANINFLIYTPGQAMKIVLTQKAQIPWLDKNPVIYFVSLSNASCTLCKSPQRPLYAHSRSCLIRSRYIQLTSYQFINGTRSVLHGTPVSTQASPWYLTSDPIGWISQFIIYKLMSHQSNEKTIHVYVYVHIFICKEYLSLKTSEFLYRFMEKPLCI